MIRSKITFLNMPHSPVIEEHATKKIEKFLHILQTEGYQTPLFAEVWLRANKLHLHHSVEIHLKTPQQNLHAESDGTDMYLVIDATIDKMIALIKKEKEKQRDKQRKQPTEKSNFKPE